MGRAANYRVLADALDNLRTFIQMVEAGRIDKDKVPALYVEVQETLEKARRLK